MPSVITFDDGKTVTYGYDASGSKLSVTYNMGGGVISKMEYAGNKVYKNGTLGTILTGEGYITIDGTTSKYHYYLKDHQGNNRVVINQGGTVQQVNHYYPFGGLFGEGSQESKQPYKYNGKEFDDLLGLNMYDYGARPYDPYSGRWINVDQLAEKYYSISPYVYVANNPVRFIDTDGRAVRVPNIESFNVLLSSLPAGARNIITVNENNFIDVNSVNAAYEKFNHSGNLQALSVIAADERIVDFDATAISYNYLNAKTGLVVEHNFQRPIKENIYQSLLDDFSGTPAEKQVYAQQLIQVGIVDKVEVRGDLGVTLRPANAQRPYPSGKISTIGNFQVYVSPVGTTAIEKAKNVGHELFGHLYFFFIGKDPRHGGETRRVDGNPELDKQIEEREREAGINFLNY